VRRRPNTLVPRSWPTGCRIASGGGSFMRLFFGIIIGGLLTVGGAYVVDTMSSPGSKMVNWEVVGKNVDTLTNMAREGWKKITG
jgi:hypothetical protein